MNDDSFSVENIINNITKYLGLSKFEKIASRLEDLPVKVKSDLCTRLRFSGEDACQKCMGICPHDLISYDQGIKIDYDGCTDCGLCAALCPTGALTSHITEDFLLAKVKNIAEDSPAVLFRCGRVPVYADDREKIAIELPCLGRITETLLVGAAVYGAGTVGLDTSECAECPSCRALAEVDRNIAAATGLLAAFGREIQFVRGSMKGADVVSVDRDRDDFSLQTRRELFTSLHRHLIIGGAAVLGNRIDKFSKKEEEPIFTDHLPRRRELLLLLLKKLGEPVKPFIPAENIGAAPLEITDDCIFCDNCVLFCPTKALNKSENGQSVSVDFTLSHCTDCGLCVNICSPKAIKTGEEIETAVLAEARSRVLIEGRVHTCQICELPFTAGKESNICHFCRLRQAPSDIELTVENDQVANEGR